VLQSRDSRTLPKLKDIIAIKSVKTYTSENPRSTGLFTDDSIAFPNSPPELGLESGPGSACRVLIS